MSAFFHSKLLLDNSASFTSSTQVFQKWKVKLIFRGAYRLSETGIVECLEIVDVYGVIWNGFMAWADCRWPSIFYVRSTPVQWVPTWLALRNESKKVLNRRRHSSSWNVVSSSQKYAASSTRSDSSSLTSPSNSVSSSPANWTQQPVIILTGVGSGGYAGDLSDTPTIYVGGYWYVYPPPRKT